MKTIEQGGKLQGVVTSVQDSLDTTLTNMERKLLNRWKCLFPRLTDPTSVVAVLKYQADVVTTKWREIIADALITALEMTRRVVVHPVQSGVAAAGFLTLAGVLAGCGGPPAGTQVAENTPTPNLINSQGTVVLRTPMPSATSTVFSFSPTPIPPTTVIKETPESSPTPEATEGLPEKIIGKYETWAGINKRPPVGEDAFIIVTRLPQQTVGADGEYFFVEFTADIPNDDFDLNDIYVCTIEPDNNAPGVFKAVPASWWLNSVGIKGKKDCGVLELKAGEKGGTPTVTYKHPKHKEQPFRFSLSKYGAGKSNLFRAIRELALKVANKSYSDGVLEKNFRALQVAL